MMKNFTSPDKGNGLTGLILNCCRYVWMFSLLQVFFPGSSDASAALGSPLRNKDGATIGTDFKITYAAVEDCPITQVSVKAFLGGAMQDPSTGGFSSPIEMRDNLRTKSYFPLSQPYTNLGYLVTSQDVTTTNTDVLARSGADAVIDWVLIEFRSEADNSQIVLSRPGLLLKNGLVTEAADGVTPLRVSLPAGNYYVSIRHRNHLGVMTAAAIPLGTAVDFTSPALDVYNIMGAYIYDGFERADLSAYSGGSGQVALWWGDVLQSAPDKVKYTGSSNDVDPINSAVRFAPGNPSRSPGYVLDAYNRADVNMDGSVIFQGTGNDVVNVLNSVLSFPPNSAQDPAFDFMLAQLPESNAYTGTPLTCSESPLPVKLINFTAEKESSTVQLKWATTAEVNADRFDVERSENAKNWKKISQIAAAGESTGILHYTFTDGEPLSDLNYYRLKMIDLDGTFAYSSVKTVEFAYKFESNIYPNPAGETLNIKVPDWQKVKNIRIDNLNGIQVYSSGKVISNIVDVKNLSEGIYILRITYTNGSVSTHKLIR